MKSVTIIGAGIAGLLAANLLTRRGRAVRVLEAQPSLPNNHSAVLRFRTSAVGDAIGIPFRRVRVVKASVPWRNPVADALAYAEKCSGTLRSDRSLPQQTEVVERWIAPPDLIPRLAEGVEVLYSQTWTPEQTPDEKVVSTIPMPKLASLVDHVWDRRPNFEWVSGVNVRGRTTHCDAYVSLYVPNPAFPFSRVSITGNEVIAECPGHDSGMLDVVDVMKEAIPLLGIFRGIGDIEEVRQDYAKILPIDEGERRRFIYETSTVRRIAFSLGRFATWRPGLLADDLIKDVNLIGNWIDSASPGYDSERHERERAHG